MVCVLKWIEDPHPNPPPEYQGRGKARAWLAGAGFILGLIFLTKAEVFLAAAIALSTGVAFAARARRGRALGILAIGALVPPLIAFILLSRAMPASEALRGTLGSWVYAFDPRITGMQFYRDMLGTADLPASLIGVMTSVGLLAALLIPVVIFGMTAKGPNSARIALTGSIVAAAIVYWVVDPQWWQGAFRGLSLVMLIVVAILAVRCWRARDDMRWTKRLVIALFGLVLLAKMALNVRIAQYGFALAMPAMLVCVAILVSWIPREVHRRGGSAAVVRAITIPFIALIIAVHLRPFANLFAYKPLVVGTGFDSFRAGDARGLAVNRMLAELSQLPPQATVATIPEGIMLNYLSRRANPTRSINLMPPEVLMFGEQNILADFQQHPPDYIIIIRRSDAASYGYKNFAADYGAQIFSWIAQNYIQVPAETAPEYPLMLLRRK
jgi:hypothetical protein